MNSPAFFIFGAAAAGIVGIATLVAFYLNQRERERETVLAYRDHWTERNYGQHERKEKCLICGSRVDSYESTYKPACGNTFHEDCVINMINNKFPESIDHILFEGFDYYRYPCPSCRREHGVPYKSKVRKCMNSCDLKPSSFVTLDCKHDFHSCCLIRFCLNGSDQCPASHCYEDISETNFTKAWTTALSSKMNILFPTFIFFEPEFNDDKKIVHSCEWCEKRIVGVRYLRCGHYFHDQCMMGYYCYQLITKKKFSCPNCAQLTGSSPRAITASNTGSSPRAITASNTVSSPREDGGWGPSTSHNDTTNTNKRERNTSIETCRWCKKSYSTPIYLECDHVFHPCCLLANLMYKIVEEKPRVCPDKKCSHPISDNVMEEIVNLTNSTITSGPQKNSEKIDTSNTKKNTIFLQSQQDIPTTSSNAYKKLNVSVTQEIKEIPRRSTQQQQSNTSDLDFSSLESQYYIPTSSNAYKKSNVSLRQEIKETPRRSTQQQPSNTSDAYLDIPVKNIVNTECIGGRSKIEVKANSPGPVSFTTVGKTSLIVSGSVSCDHCNNSNIPGKLVLPCKHKFHPCLDTIQLIIQENCCLNIHCQHKLLENDIDFLLDLKQKRITKRNRNTRRREKIKEKKTTDKY